MAWPSRFLCYHPAVLFRQYPINSVRHSSMCFPKILVFQFFLTFLKLYSCETEYLEATYGERCIRFINTAGFDNVVMSYSVKKTGVILMCQNSIMSKHWCNLSNVATRYRVHKRGVVLLCQYTTRFIHRANSFLTHIFCTSQPIQFTLTLPQIKQLDPYSIAV